MKYTDPSGYWTEDELSATLGSDWRELYFGKGAVFEGRENLLKSLLSEQTTNPLMLGILPWVMKPAALLTKNGVDLSGIDAIGFRLTGTVGVGAFAGVTGDALMNLRTGEFSLYATLEGGILAGEATSATGGWFSVNNLPSNDAYGGPVLAHGATAGLYLSSSYEQLWSAPMSIEQSAYEMPNGSAITVGGGEGLGIYRSIGYGYQVYAMDANGSRAWPPFDARKALQECWTALRVDWAQTPLPWLPRK